MNTPAETLRVAAVQLCAGADPGRNVATAARLVGAAAADGARLVVLPEKWNLVDVDARQLAGAEALDGPSLSAARRWAADHDIAILAGSISEAVPGADRAFNTSVLIAPGGRDVAIYRKLHLFDVEVGGHVYRESASAMPGGAVATGRVFGRTIGMSVCYDLRFPELYRALVSQGSEILAVPAAFTATTGAAHWEVLVRARAIENQAFVVAAGQVGTHATGTASYGHSMIVDPWGTVLAQADDDEGIITADLEFAMLADVRTRLPALRHRRSDIFSDAVST